MIETDLTADALVYMLHVDQVIEELYERAPMCVRELRPIFFELGRRSVQSSGSPIDEHTYNRLASATRAAISERVGVEPQLWLVFESGRTFELGIVSARFHQLGDAALKLNLEPLVSAGSGEADD